MTPAERVIATARAEIGYIEKETNSQLDDKTANPGDSNWNKYARDLDALGIVYNGRKNGYAWCDIFTDWMLYLHLRPGSGYGSSLSGGEGAGRWVHLLRAILRGQGTVPQEQPEAGGSNLLHG